MERVWYLAERSLLSWADIIFLRMEEGAVKYALRDFLRWLDTSASENTKVSTNQTKLQKASCNKPHPIDERHLLGLVFIF